MIIRCVCHGLPLDWCPVRRALLDQILHFPMPVVQVRRGGIHFQTDDKKR